MPVRLDLQGNGQIQAALQKQSGRSPGDEKKVADQDKRQTGYDDAVARYKQRLETKPSNRPAATSPVTIATAMSVLMAAGPWF